MKLFSIAGFGNDRAYVVAESYEDAIATWRTATKHEWLPSAIQLVADESQLIVKPAPNQGEA